MPTPLRCAPPASEPSGIVPQTIQRMAAFIRPWSRSGRDRLAQADLRDVVRDRAEAEQRLRDASAAGRGNDFGASGYARSPPTENEIAVITIVGPTPILFCNRFTTSAPKIEPTAADGEHEPVSQACRCSVRVK